MPNFYSERETSEDWVTLAEKTLGVKFARDFKECIYAFGAISLDGHDFTGCSADDNLDIVKVTQKNRKKRGDDNNLYVIEEAHIDGIVIWQDSKGIVYSTTPNSKPKKIANSLLDYITKCI